MLLISGKGRIIIVFIHLISSLSMNINLKDTLVDDTIIVQVQPVLEQVQTVTTHFDIVGNLLWDNLFAPLLFGISIPLVYKFVKKLLKRYNLKKYQSKIIREDQYKVLVKNVCLEDKYFRVNKINDDEFIIPFPETREKKLEELGFRKVYKKEVPCQNCRLCIS